MSSNNMKLITIISESGLEHHLIDDIERLGAHGYTITNARGKGQKGVRDASWSTNSNIRIEAVCRSEVAHSIAQYISDNYYKNYTIMSYISDVEVTRVNKF